MAWGFWSKVKNGFKKAVNWVKDNGKKLIGTGAKIVSDAATAMPSGKAKDFLNAGSNFLNAAGDVVDSMATNLSTGNFNGLRDTMRNNPLKDSFNSLRSTVRRK